MGLSLLFRRDSITFSLEASRSKTGCLVMPGDSASAALATRTAIEATATGIKERFIRHLRLTEPRLADPSKSS